MSPNDPYNNGSNDDHEENPFEELFRKLSSGQNINPEDLQGMGVPMDPAMMSGMFSQIQAMMSGMNSDGSANWDQARAHARRLATAENGDPAVSSTQKSAVKDAAQLAQLWLDPVIAFDRAVRVRAAQRRGLLLTDYDKYHDLYLLWIINGGAAAGQGTTANASGGSQGAQGCQRSKGR